MLAGATRKCIYHWHKKWRTDDTAAAYAQRMASLALLQKTLSRIFQGTVRGYISAWRSEIRSIEEIRWRSDRLNSVKAKIKLERQMASLEGEQAAVHLSLIHI